jgi:hypothetical protein
VFTRPMKTQLYSKEFDVSEQYLSFKDASLSPVDLIDDDVDLDDGVLATVDRKPPLSSNDLYFP